MNIGKSLNRRQARIAMLHVILLTGALMAPAGLANTYYGEIWGHVTTATDSSRVEGATLPLFGINAPVFEGDAVTGFYSYDSPTRDVDLFSAHNINITLIIGNPANTLAYIGDPQLLYSFDVSGGNLAFFSVLDAMGPDGFTHISVSEGHFYLLEEVPGGNQSISRLISGTLSTSKVPEVGSTLLYIFLLFGALVFFKRVETMDQSPCHRLPDW